ncbi:hypothetical protein CYMTET_46155 [Cymbomonas tetramitiformis]|uniref:Uncharacterized protein n=1 Tax=Cymbomonas tetramitiformis TaxID=36881 RepID=A0AAE0EYZ3_9CHLO|nr:hypothetical protein CYMTET_46155 [Cymbomonas tetramitiformis]
MSIKKKYGVKANPVEDCLVACCFSDCAVYQHANQVGEDACFTNQSVSVMLTPPTADDINQFANDAQANTAEAGESITAPLLSS